MDESLRSSDESLKCWRQCRAGVEAGLDPVVLLLACRSSSSHHGRGRLAGAPIFIMQLIEEVEVNGKSYKEKKKENRYST